LACAMSRGYLMSPRRPFYRWIQQGDLPAYRVNEQYRFNRAELLEWATAKRVNVSAAIFDEPVESGASLPGLRTLSRPAASTTGWAGTIGPLCSRESLR